MKILLKIIMLQLNSCVWHKQTCRKSGQGFPKQWNYFKKILICSLKISKIPLFRRYWRNRLNLAYKALNKTDTKIKFDIHTDYYSHDR